MHILIYVTFLKSEYVMAFQAGKQVSTKHEKVIPDLQGIWKPALCPATVKDLRSFFGAYKILSGVLPGSATHLAPLEDAIAGLQLTDKIQ